MNQQDCKVWCFAQFFISFISKRILPLFNAYPSFIQHPSITRIRRIGEIILKANVDFPRSFLGQSKEKSMITGLFLDHAFCFAERKRKAI